MHWRTRLVQPQTLARGGFASLAVPTHRGSTVLFERQADVADDWRHRDKGYTYGLYGTPTALELGERAWASWKARCTSWCLAGRPPSRWSTWRFAAARARTLVPHSAYGPNKEMAAGMLKAPGHRGRGLRSAHRRASPRSFVRTPRWSGPKAPAR